MENILFGIDIHPSGSCNTGFSSIQTVPLSTTSIESLEGSSTLPAEIENFASYVTSKCPNSLSPSAFR